MKLRRSGRPKSLDATPLIAIEIAGEKHSLRFDMAAVGQLETELNQDVIEVFRFLVNAASGGRFSVRMILAVLAAGIAYEYEPGQAPTWQEIGEQFPTLNALQPLIPLALQALKFALINEDANTQPEDPNVQAPAAESTGQSSTATAITS